MAEKAQRADAVIKGHGHDALARQSITGIERQRRGTDGPAAAINEDHDRLLRLSRARRPDVQIEAVFAARLFAEIEDGVFWPQRLQAHRRETIGDPRAAPGRNRLRVSPSEIANGRRGKGNALEDVQAGLDDADNLAAGCRHRIGQLQIRSGESRCHRRAEKRCRHEEFAHCFHPFLIAFSKADRSGRAVSNTRMSVGQNIMLSRRRQIRREIIMRCTRLLPSASAGFKGPPGRCDRGSTPAGAAASGSPAIR